MRHLDHYYFGALKNLLQGDIVGASQLVERAKEFEGSIGQDFSESTQESFPLLKEAVNVIISSYDFTRCVRPNGTAYGTQGKCKKGTESAKDQTQTVHGKRESSAGEALKGTANKESKASVKKEKYSWGTLIKVSKGSEYNAIIHPEHQDQLRKLKDGESTKFKDEQKMHWTATRVGDSIQLKGGDVTHGNKPYRLSFNRDVLE